MGATPFSYDPSTPAGLVRLLAIDSDSDNARFMDSEITAFLTLNNSNVRLAAAQALDTLASEAALVQGKTKFEGMMLDGQVIADALSKQAGELRRQVYQGEDGSDASPIGWAEWVVDPFSYRDKLVNEMLRQSST